MSSSVEIPVEVRPLVATVIARGRFANERELVSEILKVAVPALEGYDQLRHDFRTSVATIRSQPPDEKPRPHARHFCAPPPVLPEG